MNSIFFILILLGTVFFVAPAQAADGVTIANVSKADNAWIMVSAALVMFMSIPGLALFYGGLVRAKICCRY